MYKKVLYRTGANIHLSQKLIPVAELAHNCAKSACLNNHYMLKYHKTHFKSQSNYILPYGIKLSRYTYYKIRSDKHIACNLLYLAYMLFFWTDKYGYDITLHEFMSSNFREKFLERYGEVQAVN